MADTASLIARVKTEGADVSAKQLDAFATSAAKAETASAKVPPATDKASTGVKKFGSAANNASYQISDFIIQIQSGGSALTAFSQQGNQAVAAFSPMAALALTAATIIGGVLYNSLTKATVSTKDLEDASKTVGEVLQKNKDGAYELSDSYIAIANSADKASLAQAKFYEAQAATVTTTEGAKQSIEDLVDSLDTWTNGSAIGAAQTMSLGQESASLSGYIEDLSDKFGITNGEASKLVPLLAAVQRNASPENIKSLSDETAKLNDKYDGTNATLVKFNGELFKNVAVMQDAQSQADALAGSQGRLGNATNSTTQRLKEQNDQIIKNVQIGNLADKQRYSAQAAADKEAFAKREGVTEEQIKAYNAARDEEARQDIARVNDTEAKKTAAEQKAADTRSSAQAKRQESESQRQRKAAETFIDGVKRQGSDELAVITETEKQKLARLDELQQEGALKAGEYENTKTKIMLDADTARREELANREKKQQEEAQKGDDFLAQIMGQNASELELYDIQQKQKEEVAKKYREQGRIDETEYQASLVAISQNYNKKRRDSYASMLGQTTDDLRNALGEGNKMYKAFAIANAIMNTYQAANAAYQSAAAIPIAGWILGPIAAGAAVVAGLANVAKIRSAREQGGNLSAGQMSTIAERGRPEVIMPASASRVRTAQQMRQIMGDDSANRSGGDSVVIVNNTTGRIDSATTERDDEGRLRVIIDEYVTGQLADSNSNISKTRRATRAQPGF